MLGLARYSPSYEMGAYVGKGGYGKVYKVMHKPTGEVRVCKIVKKVVWEPNLPKPLHKIDDIRNEIETLKALQGCQGALQFYDAFETNEHVQIITEFLPGGTLEFKIGKTTEAELIKIVRTTIENLRRCYTDYGILHGDVKVDNVMLKYPGDLESCTLIDFGNIDRDSNVQRHGTKQYAAPESRYICSPETDVWAVGVLCRLLILGYHSSHLQISQGYYSQKDLFDTEKFQSLSQESRTLLSGMLDQYDRWSTDYILDYIKTKY